MRPFNLSIYSFILLESKKVNKARTGGASFERGRAQPDINSIRRREEKNNECMLKWCTVALYSDRKHVTEIERSSMTCAKLNKWVTEKKSQVITDTLPWLCLTIQWLLYVRYNGLATDLSFS